MRIISKLLPIFAVLALPQFADARVCERFTSKDYAQAKARFVQIHKGFTSNKSLAASLYELILNNDFYETRLQYFCESKTGISDDSCFTSEIVNKALGSKKLTALHVAAAVGHEPAMLWLIERGADINARDGLGFTPSHFAALQPNRDFLNILTNYGANPSLENRFGATPEQLWSLTHILPASESRVSLASDDGVIAQVSGDDFCERTGATFVERIKMRPLQVINDWYKGATANPLPAQFNFSAQVKAFKPKTESLYLKPIYATDSNGKQMNLGLGLFAGRDFAAGEIVEVYASEWAETPGDAEYQLNKLDGSKMRGYLAIAADGTPNVLTFPFFNALGLTSGAFAKATRPIAAGEAIMWDYGGHDIKWQLYKELGEDILNQKIAEESISSRITRVENQKVNEDADNEAILHYIANTPAVYVRLIAEKRMSVGDFKNIREKAVQHRIQADGMMQIGDDNFSMIVNGMAGLTNPTIAQFAARKAREGNVQILFMMFANMGSLKAARTEEELEVVWTRLHELFCEHHNTLGRGACHLLKKGKDEL